jgi:hypothetical protein
MASSLFVFWILLGKLPILRTDDSGGLEHCRVIDPCQTIRGKSGTTT